MARRPVRCIARVCASFSLTSPLRLPGSARLPVDRWVGLQERMEESAPESEETMRFWEWDRIRRRCRSGNRSSNVCRQDPRLGCNCGDNNARFG